MWGIIEVAPSLPALGGVPAKTFFSGRSGAARTAKNPFAFGERQGMAPNRIRQHITPAGDEYAEPSFKEGLLLHDRPYNDAKRIQPVREQVAGASRGFKINQKMRLLSPDSNHQIRFSRRTSMERSTLASFQKYQENGFSKINIYKDGNTNIFTLNLLPGQYMPEHYHPGAQLIFHVLAGAGIFIIDGKEHEVTKDDILHVLGTEEVGFFNTGEESATIYVSLFSNPLERNQ